MSINIEKKSLEESLEKIKSLLIQENASFKKWDLETGEFDVRFSYGVNAFGMRIRLFISEYDEHSYTLTVQGDFVDAMDTFGSAKRKAQELTDMISHLLSPQESESSSSLSLEPQSKEVQLGELLNYGFFKWFLIFAIALGLSSFASAGYALLAGIISALFVLIFSKSMAKKAHHIETLSPNSHHQYAWVYNVVANLSEKAGISMPEVGIYEAKDMNAFAVGMTQSNSMVAFSSALLDHMTQEEVQAVAAHEIGHIASRDMIAMTLFQGVINGITILFTFPLYALRIFNLFANNGGSFFIVDIILAFVKYIVSIVFTFFGTIVLNTFSRKREYRADAIASVLVGKQSMMAALNRLKGDTNIPAPAQSSYNCMKISAPMRFMEWFSTHPMIDNRVNALDFETYSRLATKKVLPHSRKKATIYGILFSFIGGHHIYMKRPWWIYPHLLMSFFSLPIVLAEIYAYWTQAKSDQEFEEKFVKNDGAKKIRLIGFAIMVPLTILYLTHTKEDANQTTPATPTAQQIQIAQTTPAPTTTSVEKPSTNDLDKYIGKYPTDLINDPLIKRKMKKLLGEDYKHFIQNLEVASDVTRDADFYIGSGIAAHSGGYEEAIFAINRKNLDLFVLILSEGKDFRWYSSDKSDSVQFPAQLETWYNEHQAKIN